MDRYDQARAERDDKRLALRHSAAEARNRLRPAALVKTGLDSATSKAKAKPGIAATGIVIFAAMLFRKPMFKMLKRVLQEKTK